MNEEVRRAFGDLLEHNAYCPDIRRIGADVRITLENAGAYDRVLTLYHASDIPENADGLYFENGSLTAEDGVFCLTGEAGNYEKDEYEPFSIHFTDASVEVTPYRADAQILPDSPWMYLMQISTAILDKSQLPGDYLNDREKALLPLVTEISKLSWWATIPEKSRDTGLPLLKAMAEGRGYEKIVRLMAKAEQAQGWKRQERAVRRLLNELNTLQYEPLWRELYDGIRESQASYPPETECKCDPTALRAQIQQLMEIHSYTGTYPDFVKTGAVPGIHLVESYDMTYFAGMEKNAVFHIHCCEEYFDGQLQVEFLCGTQFPRKGEAVGDIYSYLFNAKGRTFCRRVSFDGSDSSDLAQRVAVAVKKTELRRLTRQERKLDIQIDWWQLFLAVFVFMGGIFAVLMTLAMGLLCASITAIAAGPAAVPEMLTVMPWGWLFSFCWVGFGGAMGVVTVLAKRNNISGYR